MNIYINLEVAARELDSKLLLAVKAAARGHRVLIGEERAIDQLRRRHDLVPGIYHTKSLTPSKRKKELHSKLKGAGFLITSIDEEGGLVDASYGRFVDQRYSEEMLNLADAVFCWGPQDYNQLKKTFPKHQHLMYMTGSPRVDFWRPEGKDYSVKPADMPNRPYLLVSSNFGVLNNYRNFWDLIRFERNAGYFDRDPNHEKNRYYRAAETVIVMYEFIKAIEHLAEEFPDIDIVVRPHPVEQPESWRAMVDPRYENIKITRSGSITPWVHNAIAIMQNGCTTAMEATVSGIPVLTYKPVEQRYSREIPNSLGMRISTREQLTNALRELRTKRSSNDYRDNSADRDLVAERVLFEGGTFAADAIIECWEDLLADRPIESNDWNRIILKQGIKRAKEALKATIWTKSKTRLGHKFPNMQKHDVTKKICQIQAATSIKGNIDVKMLSGNMFLIAQNL